ncbi:class II fructose-bisphosphate aldolase family protein [Escherichia coli]|uniref:class II fructose-bisphosphate aldolase n=1 Tax=Escherichia coli TaxID=562 RepID=UPI0001F65F75|nr:class II fructose-bisphosphate aldolase [Escherichia coli]EFZ2272249.1 class II fructose-bisphosphate aldolase family protein [Shigella sonnei]AVV77516.1 aldolase [Escherichia coli]EAA3117994.1 aldolase [Escherichia coli]EAC0111006.1 aldolase [Escherichia coli]EEW5313812.1 aldolase [Escherichia coli]
MFADMKSMVMKAWHEHYALLAINCMNLESAHAAIRVAEKNRAPIILNLYQGHLAHFPAPVAAAVVKTLAESASVPVALALDHGKNPDCIRQAFRAGFSGLMIDASAFPLEENVRQTRAVVELAASAQLCVEGELGHLADAPRYDQAANADMMTQPTDVEPFIVQTGIDLLAVSVGTAHGMYAPGVVPAIDFQRLAEIFHCSSVPLALHGGSGTPFDQLQLCTTLGVAKINVGAAIFERGKSALLHTLCHDISIELVDALKAMELAFEEAITPYLQASGAIGKA